MTIQKICTYTGLSEDSVKVLHDFKKRLSALCKTKITTRDVSGLTFEEACEKYQIQPDEDGYIDINDVLPIYFDGVAGDDIETKIWSDLFEIESMIDFLNNLIDSNYLWRISKRYAQMGGKLNFIQKNDTNQLSHDEYEGESEENQYNGLQFSIFLTLKEFCDKYSRDLYERVKCCDEFEKRRYSAFQTAYRKFIKDNSVHFPYLTSPKNAEDE